MNYTIRVELKNGASRQTNYQRLIDSLGLSDATYYDNPLKNGSPAQLRFVLAILKGSFSQIKRITAFDEAGKEVAAFGMDVPE